MIDPVWDNWRAGFACGVAFMLAINVIVGVVYLAYKAWE